VEFSEGKMEGKDLLQISDDDLYHVAKEELNLLDTEIRDISRHDGYILLYWEGYGRKGRVIVLKDMIVSIVDGKHFKLSEKNRDWLVSRGYEFLQKN